MKELIVIRKLPINPAHLLPPHSLAKPRESEDRNHVEAIKKEITSFNNEVSADTFMVGLVISRERWWY
jgi:hypothetical protein